MVGQIAVVKVGNNVSEGLNGVGKLGCDKWD